jgi:hypothetical protein
MRRAQTVLVEGLLIPQSSKDFLTQVGLPPEEIGCIEFELNGPVFATAREEARRRKLPDFPRSERFKLLGRGGHAPDFYLVDDPHGTVVEIDLDPLKVRFVNSRVEHLGAFLLAYVKSSIRENMSDEENAACVRKIRAELVKIDPEAFSNPDYWWSQVFKQMEDGLL